MRGIRYARTNVDPTTDDEGAEEFIVNRNLNTGQTWIPCRWSALRRLSALADVRELSLSVLFVMQEMSISNYGGKFSDFLDDLGNPRITWEICADNRSSEVLKTFVHNTARVCFRFVRMFNLLHCRFTQSVAVNLLDGLVTQRGGICDLMHFFITFLSRDRGSARTLSHHVENCASLMACTSQFSLDQDVKVTGYEGSDMDTLQIEHLWVTRVGGAVVMDRAPLVMLKLATVGLIWNTDVETRSLLVAVSPPTHRTIGVWRPLSRDERNCLTDAVDVEGRFRITGTSTWVSRTSGHHSFMRMQFLYHRPNNKPKGMRVRYVPMPSCELKELSNDFVRAYVWHLQHPASWARELHERLSILKAEGHNPQHENIGSVILLAHMAAENQFGWSDGMFEMLFGPINTTFSYACEPTSWEKFAELHLNRCMRVIGVTSRVDGIPLYRWQRRNGDDSWVSVLAEKAWTLEPILAAQRGVPSPSIGKGWDVTAIW